MQNGRPLTAPHRTDEVVALVAFFVRHLDGNSDRPANAAGFPALLDELAGATVEHGDVAVTHESGWTLTVMARGRVIWENVEEDDEPRHADDLQRGEVLRLLEELAAGDLEAVESRQWAPGYGP